MGAIWILAHLRQRPLASLALVLVLALIGGLVSAAVAWQRGLDRAAQAGADPGLTYLMARGSEDAAERSVIEPSLIDQLRAQLPGPLSVELLHMGMVEGERRGRATWRGIDPATPRVRQTITLAAGRWPAAEAEAVVGDRLARELGLAPGDRIGLLGEELQVVGRLPAELGFAGGEVWVPRQHLSAITGRPSASLIVLGAAAQQATMLLMMRPDLGLIDQPETRYLAGFAARLAPLRVIAWLVSSLLIAAAVAGALAAAVARADARKRSLATLRSLGLAPLRLVAWQIGEAVLIALFAFGVMTLALQALDGSVLSLGGIAPVFRIDAPVVWAGLAALGASLVVLLMPVIAWLWLVPLSRQLRSF